MSLQQLLKDGAKELGVELNSEQIELFMKYLDNLQTWNKNINLTSINNDREIIINHFLDSISIAPIIKTNKSLLDIGSGGGFPGLPLKIVHPELRVTLLDSVNKKVSFLKDTIRKLALENIDAIWGRAEDTNNNIPRHGFDYVVNRAVGSIPDTLSLSLPYVSKDGEIILMRGKRGDQELKQDSTDIKKEYKLLDYKEFVLPHSDLQRIVIILRPNRQ